MSAPSHPEEIRQRMQDVRQDLNDNVEELVDHAQALTDWKFHVQKHPLLAAGIAATVGYLVVPHKLNVMTPDPKTLAKLAKTNRLVVQHKPDTAARSGVAHSMITIVSHMAMRAAMGYAGQKLAGLLESQSNSPAGEEASQ